MSRQTRTTHRPYAAKREAVLQLLINIRRDEAICHPWHSFWGNPSEFKARIKNEPLPELRANEVAGGTASARLCAARGNGLPLLAVLLLSLCGSRTCSRTAWRGLEKTCELRFRAPQQLPSPLADPELDFLRRP